MFGGREAERRLCLHNLLEHRRKEHEARYRSGDTNVMVGLRSCMNMGPESLIDRVQHIDALARTDLRRYLGDKMMDIMEQAKDEQNRLTLDYVTIFTNSEEECDKLNTEATAAGEQFYKKNGNMYELSQEVSAIPFVRIGEPNARNTSLGGADYALGIEAFNRAKQLIIANAPDNEIKTRIARKQEEGAETGEYTYVKAINPDSRVFPVCLSTSFVKIVR